MVVWKKCEKNVIVLQDNMRRSTTVTFLNCVARQMRRLS